MVVSSFANFYYCCSLLFSIIVLFLLYFRQAMFKQVLPKVSVPCVVFLISTFVFMHIFFYVSTTKNYYSPVTIISCWKNVYLPGYKLPELRLNTIRQISHEKLKRRLSNTEYNTYKALLTGLVEIFSQFNIRYTMCLCYNYCTP